MLLYLLEKKHLRVVWQKLCELKIAWFFNLQFFIQPSHQKKMQEHNLDTTEEKIRVNDYEDSKIYH